MPFSATVLRVMIASPGDVQKERAVVREVISEWNSTNGAHRNVMLLATGWETDVAPEMGDAPQHIIDKRILEDADLLVGMFWTRLGTPTASYASGAVEEIEEHLKAGKPAPLDSVDPTQYQALKAFKDSCRTRGLFETYADVDDFRRKVSKDLQLVMNSDPFASVGGATQSTTTSSVTRAPLSPDALVLLSAASADGSGTILFERFGGGAEISSNNKVLNEDSSPRTLARWEGAIEELEKGGLLRATSATREVFELTHDGFAAADAAKAGAPKTGLVT
jgi:hypothetical protein